ncbi:hypothetical protein GCM10022206_45080 [Streptomyces chiangmaiensis]
MTCMQLTDEAWEFIGPYLPIGGALLALFRVETAIAHMRLGSVIIACAVTGLGISIVTRRSRQRTAQAKRAASVLALATASS